MNKNIDLRNDDRFGELLAAYGDSFASLSGSINPDPLIDYIESVYAPLAGKADDKLELSDPWVTAVRKADHLCPTELSSPDRWRWKAAFMRDQLSAPLAAAVPAEEASDVNSVVAQLPDIHAKLIEAYTAGAMRNGGEGIDAGAYKCAEKIMRAWDLPDLPAEPAPIQASALTDSEIAGLAALADRIEEANEQPMVIARSAARSIDKVLARLSTPTAQGTAQSIDTPEFRALLNAIYDIEISEENYSGLVAFIQSSIAAQAPAGRDAIRDEALLEAMALCDAKYEARVALGLPREASTARALSDEINALRAASHAAEQTSGGAA